MQIINSGGRGFCLYSRQTIEAFPGLFSKQKEKFCFVPPRIKPFSLIAAQFKFKNLKKIIL
jgi:hypothetical protein